MQGEMGPLVLPQPGSLPTSKAPESCLAWSGWVTQQPAGEFRPPGAPGLPAEGRWAAQEEDRVLPPGVGEKLTTCVIGACGKVVGV